MGITKKIKIDLNSFFIFLFLIVFPFGQIIRLGFNLAGLNIPLQPLDVVVGLGAIYSILFQKERSKIFKPLVYLLSAVVFSFLFSILVFGQNTFYGLFYLIRITAYALFLNYVWNFVKKNKGSRYLLFDSLLAVSIVSAVFGWIQYFTFPDIKPFFVYGWDMHLLRLVGTFLDPTFLGIIIVFGLILSIYKYIDNPRGKYLLITVFLLVSLAFTYSRASYLAFLAGVFVIAFTENKYRKMLFWVVGLLMIALVLPTAKNRSIELTRTFSISARFTNYGETLLLFKRFPIFGVGYNNMCIARNQYIGMESFSSHACSGSDSSLFFILATTGVVGLMVFAGFLFGIPRLLKQGFESRVVMATFAALFVHSLFSNSLFFPWVMGYLAILLAASIKE